MTHKNQTLSQRDGWARKIRNGNGGDLAGAYLRYYKLKGAQLRGANLAGADLFGVDLAGADLAGADLSGASLEQADLSGADLTGARLTGANLHRANLRGAKLDGHELMDVKQFNWASLPERLLPWLTAHPHFSKDLPGLNVTKD